MPLGELGHRFRSHPEGSEAEQGRPLFVHPGVTRGHAPLRQIGAQGPTVRVAGPPRSLAKDRLDHLGGECRRIAIRPQPNELVSEGSRNLLEIQGFIPITEVGTVDRIRAVVHANVAGTPHVLPVLDLPTVRAVTADRGVGSRLQRLQGSHVLTEDPDLNHVARLGVAGVQRCDCNDGLTIEHRRAVVQNVSVGFPCHEPNLSRYDFTSIS